ncbi:ATP-binding protein [Treponema sp. OMZ 840]|uniref:YifB family Mg chelatase-like AAA ATPase n=1 Tax=Treponema sp. OMZ 840 TaxID=244313 RepID=UPI003D8E7B0C
MNIISFSPFGYEGSLVTVEVDLRRGIPAVDMVGLADNAVKEARERMRAAIRNSGFDFPIERILISLSPADVKKEGAGFDLAIALAVLNKSICQSIAQPPSCAKTVLVMGELELSGRIRPVRGVHAALSTARENGISYCIIPAENKAEAAVFTQDYRCEKNEKSGKNCEAPKTQVPVKVPAMRVFAAARLTDAFGILSELNALNESEPEERELSGREQGCTSSAAGLDNSSPDKNGSAGGILQKRTTISGVQKNTEEVVFADFPPELDYGEIKGQTFFIRALQIAAAGRHNLIVYGSPGCGKTLALSRFYTLLPLLTEEEALPVTRIYSIAGLLPAGTQILRDAPFRRPHQSASLEGMIGGGLQCRPGEISLAHNGVLFLDEAADFRLSVLQALRVPLEEGKITLSRAARTAVYPALFQLLLAANPCPCGNFGSADKICLCHPRAVEQYWRRFSAPLLDRIDIRIALSNDTAPQAAQEQKQTTQSMRKGIGRAVALQRHRQTCPNARLDVSQIRSLCPLDGETELFLTDSAGRFGFSSRGVHSCIKLARTIADIEGRRSIQKRDMEEAVLLHRNAGGIHMMF